MQLSKPPHSIHSKCNDKPLQPKNRLLKHNQLAPLKTFVHTWN